MSAQLHRQGLAVRQPHPDVRHSLDYETIFCSYSRGAALHLCATRHTKTSVCSLKLMCLVVQALGDCRHAQVRRTDLAEQTSQLLKLSLMRMQHVSC